jgi:spore protease
MYLEEKEGIFTVSRLKISDDESEAVVGQPKGEYLTVEFPSPTLLGEKERHALASLIARELTTLWRTVIGHLPDPASRVLIAGLGNAGITSDAIGPRTLSRVPATGHLALEEPELLRALGAAEVYTVSPGVLSQTGTEAADILRDMASRLKPDLIIAIDALAARSPSRLMRTVQLSDTGICPGSGIGNHRSAIRKSTVGVPVVSIGVPTVVEAMTLVADRVGGRALPQDEEERDLFFVTPKDVDCSVELISDLLARALREAFRLPD